MKNSFLISFAWLVLFSACGQNTPKQTQAQNKQDLMSCGKPLENQTNIANMEFPVKKSEEEWKKSLTEEQYRVLRLKGTERSFTGKLYKNKDKGIYTCAACGNELFKSDTKFESGTGWPSYFDVLPKSVITQTDMSHGMVRTEVMCAKCGGHLGHVFDDGPNPTGMRYCINSVSMDFKKEEEKKKEEK
jgi:peptide-methionine (R)-S-oxide reductase